MVNKLAYIPKQSKTKDILWKKNTAGKTTKTEENDDESN